MSTITIKDIKYNAVAGAYQARVDVSARGKNFRYPCEVAGPLDMNVNDVRRRLKQQAIGMSDTGSDLWSVGK